MTYVREQTSAELAAHMRSLQKMAGWFDPLSDRLWQEVEALKAENERLKTLRSVTERDLAQELEVWRHGPSCWNCGDTGDVHDIVGEWRGQCDCNAAKLIDVAAERDQLKAENERLRSGMKGDYDLDAWLDWTREAEALAIELPEPYAVVGDYAACGGGRSVWDAEYAENIDDRMCQKTPVYDRASLEAAGVRVKS